MFHIETWQDILLTEHKCIWDADLDYVLCVKNDQKGHFWGGQSSNFFLLQCKVSYQSHTEKKYLIYWNK